MSMCPSRSSSRLATLVVFAVFLLAGVAQAQTITGSITGTVVDSSGAIVPGSKLTVTNEATGAERTLITTENGVFIFTNLVPTTYSVKIEQPGFRPVTRTALTLTSGDRLALGSIQLEADKTSEASSVTGEVAALKTESADVPATLGTPQISVLGSSKRRGHAGALRIEGCDFACYRDGFTGLADFELDTSERQTI